MGMGRRPSLLHHPVGNDIDNNPGPVRLYEEIAQQILHPPHLVCRPEDGASHRRHIDYSDQIQVLNVGHPGGSGLHLGLSGG